MRVLALDPGERRIGVAISDELKMIAQPLEFISAQPFNTFLERLKELLRTKEVELVVVGMPRNMDGSYGESAQKVKEFVMVLKEAITIPVKTWDERLTTVQAQRLLRESSVKKRKHRQRVDQSAAAILLQSYLDSFAVMDLSGGNEP